MSHNKDWVGLMVTNCTIILSISIKASQHWVKNQFALRDSALLLSPTFSPFPPFIQAWCLLEFCPKESDHDGLWVGFSKSFRHSAGDPRLGTALLMSCWASDSRAVSNEGRQITGRHQAPVNHKQ